MTDTHSKSAFASSSGFTSRRSLRIIGARLMTVGFVSCSFVAVLFPDAFAAVAFAFSIFNCRRAVFADLRDGGRGRDLLLLHHLLHRLGRVELHSAVDEGNRLAGLLGDFVHRPTEGEKPAECAAQLKLGEGLVLVGHYRQQETVGLVAASMQGTASISTPSAISSRFARSRHSPSTSTAAFFSAS